MAEPGHPPYLYSFDEPHRLDPDPIHARLRAEEPVARVKLPFGREGWLILRYEAVKAILGDPRFSRAQADGTDMPRVYPIPTSANPLARNDPPEHTRLRRVVVSAFTERRTEQRRSRAQEIVDRLLDEMLEQGPPADFVECFALRLPISMICEILGVPYEDHAHFRKWAVTITSTTAYSPDEIQEALANLRAYLSGLVARRRAQPSDDLLTTMVQARDELSQLSEDELITFGVSLLSAGHDSTSNQIANFLYLLLTHPDQMAWLRANPSRTPQAVEEMLRFVPLAAGAPNAAGHARLVLDDVEIDGTPIAKGEAVLPSIISANRDPEVFTDPERLDLGREENPHIAFGHGVHHCLGANLARMELQVAFAAILDRIPTIRLAVPPDEVPWKVGLLARGPVALPIAW